MVGTTAWGWGGALWLLSSGVHAQALVDPLQAQALLRPAQAQEPSSVSASSSGAVWTVPSQAQSSSDAEAPSDAAGPDAADTAPSTSLLAHWREQLDRHTPRVTTHLASFSMADRDIPDGPLRSRPAGLDGAKGHGNTWSLKANADYADLRQALRGRVLLWQPMEVGDWKLGASVGSTRALSTASADRSTYAVMPMASFQTRRCEWRVGVLPASSQTNTTLMVRLRIKAF